MRSRLALVAAFLVFSRRVARIGAVPLTSGSDRRSSALRTGADVAFSGYTAFTMHECNEGRLCNCEGTQELWHSREFVREENGRFLSHEDVEVDKDSSLPVVYMCGSHGMTPYYRVCVTLVKDFDSSHTCLKLDPSSSDPNRANALMCKKSCRESYPGSSQLDRENMAECSGVCTTPGSSFCDGKNVYELSTGKTAFTPQKALFGADPLRAANDWLQRCSSHREDPSAAKPSGAEAQWIKDASNGKNRLGQTVCESY